MSEPLWHHYIPRMYLRAWLDPKEVAAGQHVLWVYKQGLKPKRKGTKAVGAETAFYVSEVPGAENKTEAAIAQIENVATKHLQKLRDGNINLTDQERAEFSTFLGITKFRTKYAREMMNSTAIEILRQGFGKTLREGKVPEIVAKMEEERGNKFDVSIEKVEEMAAKIADGTTQLTQESKGWSIKNAFERGQKLGDTLWQLPWGLLEAPDNEAFITSDNPLHIADPPAKASGPKGFRNTTAMQFVFPISPRFLLMGDFINRRDGKAKIDADRVAYFNVRHLEEAYEQVYASFHCDELQKLLDEIFAERAPLIQKPPPGMLD